MRKFFDEAQVIGFLLEIDTAVTLQDLCRKHGFSEASYALLRRTCAGKREPKARQLRRLEVENRRLKALLDVQQLERERIKQALRQQF